jgi:hypothetical protein
MYTEPYNNDTPVPRVRSLHVLEHMKGHIVEVSKIMSP